MGELLPCPWCGKELVGAPTVVEGSTFRWRQLSGCCTDGPEVRHNTLTDDQSAAELESTRRAIEAWNTRAHPSWQLIATAPRDGTRIMAPCEDVVYTAHFDNGEWIDSYDFTVVGPTHWMPMPPPPGEGE